VRIIYSHDIFGIHPYGGVSRYFHEISSRIAGIRDVNVEVFAPIHVNEYLQNGEWVRGIKVPLIPRTARLINVLNTAVARTFMKLKRGIDIYHETYYAEADCCPEKSSRVVTCFDMISEKFPEMFFQQEKVQRIKALALKRADHIICISENTRKDLVEMLEIPQEKTSVVYLGSSFDVGDSKGEREKKPFLLYVGNRSGYKNFERFLKAYGNSRILRNHFSIVCFGGGGFNEHELELAHTLNIPRDKLANISGSDETLGDLYSSASVFVYPSLYEGFGIPPLEAMSRGCPVACSNSSSLPEVVGDAAELFDPEDEEQMGSAIEKIVSDSAKSETLIRSGYKRVRLFSWQKCALDTLNAYNRLFDIK
jgi:glycosyltransferase involved in cell wall biosynthesis